MSEQQDKKSEGIFDEPIRRIGQEIFDAFFGMLWIVPESFFHTEFGERYYKNIHIVMGVGVFSIGTILVRDVAPFSWLFITAFLLLGIRHRFRIFYRNWYTDITHHSYSNGESWLQRLLHPFRRFFMPFLSFYQDVTQRIIQPTIFIISGFFIFNTKTDTYLGLWLIIWGVALFLREAYRIETGRAELLNILDKDIESGTRQKFFEVLNKKEEAPPLAQPSGYKVKSQGFKLIIPPTRNQKEHDDVINGFKRRYSHDWAEAQKKSEGQTELQHLMGTPPSSEDVAPSKDQIEDEFAAFKSSEISKKSDGSTTKSSDENTTKNKDSGDLN